MNEETRILLVNNLKPEDYMIITDNFHKLDKEIERLNKIINEFEKYINEEVEDYNKILVSKLLSERGKEKYEAEKICFLDILDKLNELKEKN